MNFNYIIVSYCTNHLKYIQYGKELDKQLSSYNLNYNIEFLKFHYKTKVRNCAYKPQFILDKLLEYKIPIIWIDVDSIINNQPIRYIDNLVKQSFDIGVVYTPERKHPATDAIHIYKYTDGAISFLKYRIKLNEDSSLKLAHNTLDSTLKHFEDKINIINIRNDVNTWFKAVFSRNDEILEYK